uniref:LRIM1/APL1C-like dimerization domain-containing protein n=1 Tax=Anopheles epiroticus TaxID=199890 RepID=A0A240PPW5_9DIPT
MFWLRAVSLLSVFLFSCTIVAGDTDQYIWSNPPYRPIVTTRRSYNTATSGQWYNGGYRNSMPRQEYKCHESNQQYDCVFYGVHIDGPTQNVYFGFENENNERNITFKNSTIRSLSDALLRSFRQVELLDLNDLQLKEVGPTAFTYGQTIQSLYMGHNAIEHLPPYLFHNMQSLSVLVLDRNSLRSLPQQIFSGTPKLSVLSISNNNLETIEDGTFEATTELNHLQVSSNKLTHINLSLIPSLFYGNVSFNNLTTLAVPIAVKELDASHNRISTVSGPLNGELALLKLQHNSLKDTAWLLRYAGLVDVDLSHNELENISSDHFRHMTRLERLYLSHNQLVKLNLGNKPIGNLNVLDLSHNHLLYVERNQLIFDRVEYLYLAHNSIVKLKLSANNKMKYLTLSDNDLDCQSLRNLLQDVDRPVVGDSDHNCKPDYKLEQGLCCKESDMAYLDRLIQYIHLTSVAEKQHRAKGRCSADDAITSANKLSNLLTEKSDVMLQANQQLQEEERQLQNAVRELSAEQKQLEQGVQGLLAEIDTNLRRYRLPKDGLARPSVNLAKVLTHLKERHEFKLRETQNRQAEADAKKREMERLEEENIVLQKQLDDKKKEHSKVKQDTKSMKIRVNQLEAKKNRNPEAVRITK